MKMKTFRAPTMRAALNRVKAVLGPDAVILSSRELGSGAVELTAALDPDPQGSTVSGGKAGKGAAPELMNGMMAELKEMRRELARLRAERSVSTKANRQWDQLMEELKSLGRLMGAKSVAPERAGDAVLARLVAGGVEASLARSLVEGVAGLETGKAAALAEQIQKSLTPAPAVWDRARPTVAAFVGPTGVGKTTSMAKIAAQASLYHGRDVAIVAADTYRIAGVQQAQTYGDLLDVPVAVANNAYELKQACKRFSDKDLVLVDTTGGSPWRDETLANTDALLDGIAVERHLCVSAATPGADLGAMVGRYAKSGLSSLIVTKMDEARTVGGLLSTVWGTDFHISHVMCGQNVPADISSPNPVQLTQAVLG